MLPENSPSATIRNALETRIRDGVYAQRLPTMRALATEFDVNLKTIQKAIQRLRDEGVVTPLQGSAVYVNAAGGVPATASRGAVRRRPNREPSRPDAGTPVGLVCDSYGRGYHPYFSEVCRGIIESARDASLDLHFIPTPSLGFLGEDPDFFRARVLDPGLRGVISLSANEAEVRRYVEHGVRFVACGDYLATIPAALAGCRVPRLGHRWDDEVAGGVRRLIAAGHRRIALVGIKGADGFASALFEYGVSVPDAWRNRIEGNGERFGYEACRRLLNEAPRPTALMVTDDFTCRGAMMALLEVPLRVPQDVSVLTFANATSDLHLFRPLSTIECDGRREGRAYVSALRRELARSPRSRSRRDVWPLRARFNDRGSIAPPAPFESR